MGGYDHILSNTTFPVGEIREIMLCKTARKTGILHKNLESAELTGEAHSAFPESCQPCAEDVCQTRIPVCTFQEKH